LLLLAENAAAIMISGTSDTGPVVLDMSLQEISEILKSYQPDTKVEKKALKKANKFSSKINKLKSSIQVRMQKKPPSWKAKSGRKSGAWLII